jgi:hypothetical protein
MSSQSCWKLLIPSGIAIVQNACPYEMTLSRQSQVVSVCTVYALTIITLNFVFVGFI